MSPSPTPSVWQRSFAALEFREFRWLLASNVAFFLAMQGQVLTRTFLAWDLTGEEMALAYINVAFAVPMLLCSLLGGAVSDRVERRRLILLGQSLLILNEATVLLLLVMNQLEFWHLLIAGTVAGAIIPFIMPARTAIVYRVVGPERLGNAIALSGGVMNLSRVLGPALMGFASAAWSTQGAYAIAVGLFLLSLTCVSQIKPDPTRAESARQTHVIADAIHGIRYIFEHRSLRACLLLGLLPMFLAMPLQNLFVIFADRIWQVGEQGLGLMMGLSGLGGVIGSAWMAQRKDTTPRIAPMMICTLLFAMLLVGFALSPHFFLALLALVFANIFASAGQTLNSTANQLLVDDQQRGRMSAFMMMAFGLTPLGVLPMAYLAQILGAPGATVIACLLLIATVLVLYLSSPSLRSLDAAVARELAEPGNQEADRA